MRASEILSGLNEAQKEAVTYGRGPLLILAGPGSGKTRVLTHRVAWLIASDLAQPEEVLAVTFTNKAAGEMKQRIQNLLKDSAGVRAQTFHSACLFVLRQDSAKIGIDPRFTVVDEESRRELLERVAEDLRLEAQDVSSAARAVSFAKNCLIGPDEFPEWATKRIDRKSLLSQKRAEVVSGYIDTAPKVYAAYQKLLRKVNGLDFDDLLFEAVRLFRERPDVLEKWSNIWKWVLVDEYQDTNRAQYEWLQMLVKKHRNVTAVGDPDQSIYGWRAADVENILRFKEDFPEAKVVALEKNYRSVPAVTSLADRLIQNNTRREKKALVPVRPDGGEVQCAAFPDEHYEAEFLVRKIFALQKEKGLSWADFAVLYRTNALSRVYEEALAKHGIPYTVVGSVGFWGRREVKDVLAHLQVAVNPRDAVSLRRICLLQPGVGKALTAQVVTYVLAGYPAKEALSNVAGGAGVSRNARSSLDRLAKALAALEEGIGKGKPAAELCKYAVEATGYMKKLAKDQSEEGQERAANVGALVSAAAEIDSAGGSVTDLLERAALASAEGEEGKKDAVRLMTLHKAKGLEFPVVFLVAAEEGNLPHFRNDSGPALEEERRLCFVGATRAKDCLYVTYCLERNMWGKRWDRGPSQFLKEMGFDLGEEEDEEEYEEEIYAARV